MSAFRPLFLACVFLIVGCRQDEPAPTPASPPWFKPRSGIEFGLPTFIRSPIREGDINDNFKALVIEVRRMRKVIESQNARIKLLEACRTTGEDAAINIP